MKVIWTVICSFLMIGSAFAGQQTTRPGQMDQPPGAAQTNPQPQVPQAQPPDTRAPQTGQTPSAPQPQGPQGAPQSAQPPSIDEQVAVLTQELNLSTEQQTKVKSILTDQRQQAMGVVGDQSLSRADKIEKIHTIREGTISKVRESLNDDQKKKLDQMLQGPAQSQPPQSQPNNTPPKQK